MANTDKLDRFLNPQDITHGKALMELRAGLKLSHWVWWELPQLRGLGSSKRAIEYGIADLDEAARYLGHPVLGPRLVELCMALMVHVGKSPESIMGPVDAVKLQSMATLFEAVDGAPAVFCDLLDGYFAGMRCRKTQDMLAAEH